MSRLFMTLATNIQLYPQWVAYLKDRQPKTLIVWGRNDPLFLPAAPDFVKQIVPTADLRYFDGSHFVLDEYADAIAEAIIEMFSPMPIEQRSILSPSTCPSTSEGGLANESR